MHNETGQNVLRTPEVLGDIQLFSRMLVSYDVRLVSYDICLEVLG